MSLRKQVAYGVGLVSVVGLFSVAGCGTAAGSSSPQAVSFTVASVHNQFNPGNGFGGYVNEHWLVDTSGHGYTVQDDTWIVAQKSGVHVCADLNGDRPGGNSNGLTEIWKVRLC